MPNSLDIVLSDFNNDIGRVENILNLTKLFREFGASEPPAYADTDPAWTEAVNLHVESKERRTDMPIISGSLLLYTAGRFEYFVRQIVEAMTDEIAEKTSDFKKMPPSIQKAIKQKTLEIAQNPRKYGHDESSSEILLEQLVQNIKGTGGKVSINSTVISITEANMRPTVLADLLKIVGILDFWREIGKQTPVKLALETKTEPETTAEAQKILNTIMEERNQIAHPTGTTTFPDTDQVLKFATFLKLLAANIADQGKLYLNDLVNPPATNRPH
ncbi:hypothetical protein GVN24_30650 [Rhizobium sp. CRIBSB]|nr:hypothetical protein [Rhizobium sp. CRIBSB]